MHTISKTTKTQHTVTHLRAKCGVRYWEDAHVNGVEDQSGTLIPKREGEYWVPTIDLETGQILDWPVGTQARLHYKVCDDGLYALLNADGEVVVEIDSYVPAMMSPGGSGYGDYVIMTIDETGKIENWHADLSPFEPET